MSEFEVKKAKEEAKQSNQQLDQALDHLKNTVDVKAGQIGEKRDQLSHLLEGKREVAQDMVENGFKGAEEFITRQTELVKGALENTKGETDRFLQDIENSVDSFVDNVQQSLTGALDVLDDNRIKSYATMFFMGCLVGGIVLRRYGSGAASKAELKDKLKKPEPQEFKKIA